MLYPPRHFIANNRYVIIAHSHPASIPHITTSLSQMSSRPHNPAKPVLCAGADADLYRGIVRWSARFSTSETCTEWVRE
jgi:hypothetical protein